MDNQNWTKTPPDPRRSPQEEPACPVCDGLDLTVSRDQLDVSCPCGWEYVSAEEPYEYV
jgi:hypothetical protein